jgi:hypothetical protein
MTGLHPFRSFWGLPDASPFCMKVETCLRFRGILQGGARRAAQGAWKLALFNV